MVNAPDKTIFISRAGADKDLATRIGAILRGAGYGVILQDDDFGHASFMESMDAALRSGARVAALLSDEYQQSKFCRAEWQAAIADDPTNQRQRLIVFKIKECSPGGLLKPLIYTDLCKVRDHIAGLTSIVLNAVARGRPIDDAAAPGTLIDPDAVWEVPSFTGRAEALEQLRKALFAEGGLAAVTAVHGTGGMGKSALAREYARRNRQDYSILWWLNAETEDGIIGGLIRLGARFIPGLDREKDRTQAAMLARERVFAPLHKPALLVFDNVEKQDLLRKWKPHENCHVLVTSRLHGWGGGFRPVEINKWPPEDARDYLLRESARADLKDADADEIAKTLGYLPLALAHTAAVLRDNPAMTAKSYLARIETLLDRAPEGAEYGKAVYATFQQALAQAEKRAPGAAAILCLAAFYAPDDIPFELFEQEPDIYPDVLTLAFDDGAEAVSLRAVVSDPRIREDVLSALASFSLIKLNLETHDFSVHRLVQAACRDLADANRSEWVRTAVEVIDAAYPSGEFDTWFICERLSLHAEAVSAHAPDICGPPLLRLLSVLDVYLSERAQFSRAEAVSRRALAIGEEIYGPDSHEVAVFLNNLAHSLSDTDRFLDAEPLIRRALAIDEQCFGVDSPEVAVELRGLALLLKATRRYAEAETLLRRALAIDENSYGPNHPSVARGLSNLSALLQDVDRPEEAEALSRRALAIGEKILASDHPNLAIYLGVLAQLLSDTGRWAEAAPLAERAVAIRRATLGEEHPHTKLALRNYAAIRAELEKQSTP